MRAVWASLALLATLAQLKARNTGGIEGRKHPACLGEKAFSVRHHAFPRSKGSVIWRVIGLVSCLSCLSQVLSHKYYVGSRYGQ